jgi:hypothetical protein
VRALRSGGRGVRVRGRLLLAGQVIAAMGTMGVASAVAAESAAAAPVPAPACELAAVDTLLVPRFRRGQYLDVHNLCVTLDVICAGAAGGAGPMRSILDALSLMELDEHERARALLIAVTQQSRDATMRERAAVLLAWSFLRDGDRAAFQQRLPTLPAEPRLRLDLLSRADDEPAFQRLLGAAGRDRLRPDVGPLVADLRAARRTKRPWLAGVLSAVIPGAGQAYAGSWQGAAVAFVLNATLIGATGELATRRLYLPAVAAGVAASFFYVGSIFNAADLATRRNDTAASAPARALEDRLVPEAHP